MSETSKPEPSDPADAGTDETPKPKRGESFLAPDDAGADGDDPPPAPRVPPPPD